jgi:RNA-binding protein YlmH
MIGDIAIFENVGYLFAEEKMAEHILTSLTEVKRTTVTVSIVEDIPTGELFRTETITVQVQSERLDAVIAKVFSLSREDAQGYFAKSLVFVNGAVTESVSHVPKAGDRISVRTKGRFIYGGPVSLSKKGKLNVDIDVYI